MVGRASSTAYAVIVCCLKAPLAAAVRDRSDPDPAVRARSDHTAVTRIVCDALAQQASR